MLSRSFSWRLVLKTRLAGLVFATAFGCGGQQAAPSEVASLQITSPADGLYTNASSLSIEVSAGGIVPNDVQLLVDGGRVATLTAAPYVFSWSTVGLADGVHVLSAESHFGKTTENRVSNVVTVNLDRTAPSVVSTSPQNGGGNVDASQPVQIIFSEPMDTASVQAALSLVVSGTKLSPTVMASPDGRTFTITTVHVYHGQFQLSVSGAKDLAGNEATSSVTFAWNQPQLLTIGALPVGASIRATAIAADSPNAFALTSDPEDGNVLHVWTMNDDDSTWTDIGGPGSGYSAAYPAVESSGSLWIYLLRTTNDPNNPLAASLSHWDHATWTSHSAPPPKVASDGKVYLSISAGPSDPIVTLLGALDTELWNYGSWQGLGNDGAVALPADQVTSLLMRQDGVVLNVIRTGPTTFDVGSYEFVAVNGRWKRATVVAASSAVARFTTYGNNLVHVWAQGTEVAASVFDSSAWTPRAGATEIGFAPTDLSTYATSDGDIVVATQYQNAGNVVTLSRSTAGPTSDITNSWTTLASNYCPVGGCGLIPDKQGRPVLLNWGHPALRYNE